MFYTWNGIKFENKYFSTPNEIAKHLRKKQMTTFIKYVNYLDRENEQKLLHKANYNLGITSVCFKMWCNSNSAKETDIQVQEAQRVPNKMKPKRPTPKHIIITLLKVKDKERILKAAREKQLVTYKGIPIRLSADFSTETLRARREWRDIFNMMKEKSLQPRILYPARLSFRIEGEIKIFSDKQQLKEFVTTKPALQEMLKGIL